jgi:hypothetical protein
MVADVIPWLGPAASLITAVGALPLANLVQNRGEHRVRSSIASSLKTIKELDDLKLSNEIALRKKLEQSLDDDLSALAHIVQTRNEHKLANAERPPGRQYLPASNNCWLRPDWCQPRGQAAGLVVARRGPGRGPR